MIRIATNLRKQKNLAKSIALTHDMDGTDVTQDLHCRYMQRKGE